VDISGRAVGPEEDDDGEGFDSGGEMSPRSFLMNVGRVESCVYLGSIGWKRGACVCWGRICLKAYCNWLSG
jgi:hypothetical protein